MRPKGSTSHSQGHVNTTEVQRLLSIFDEAYSKRTGKEAPTSANDPKLMLDIERGQRGHPIGVEDLIYRYFTRQDKVFSLQRFFAAIPELLDEISGNRKLQVDPAVQAICNYAGLSPMVQQRWFLNVRLESRETELAILFPNIYTCEQVLKKYGVQLEQAARERGYRRAVLVVA